MAEERAELACGGDGRRPAVVAGPSFSLSLRWRASCGACRLWKRAQHGGEDIKAARRPGFVTVGGGRRPAMTEQHARGREGRERWLCSGGKAELGFLAKIRRLRGAAASKLLQ
ncbi:hypothetical protein E2562_014119 [Oryza meyeriana var. granulata]|uniref:Uncharacterized protein n=1 Tax=Oryza meyeriana var. granulata TaxID=110450 RepID=A0A6G1F8G7_9ORYZ|nr:hypothetical protein E2562_014119 [Oryza meyeriana var. granulata]